MMIVFHMKKTILFLLFLLVILAALSSFFWFYQVRFLVGRASVSQASFSVDNSYLFITPLRAQANGDEQIRLTVFVLNNQGLGVLGKTVEVAQDPALVIKAIQPQTDNTGKAIYDISSTKSGEYYLEVKIEDKPLLQKAHLSFY